MRFSVRDMRSLDIGRGGGGDLGEGNEGGTIPGEWDRDGGSTSSGLVLAGDSFATGATVS